MNQDVSTQLGSVDSSVFVKAMLEMEGRHGGTCAKHIEASPRDSWNDFVEYVAKHHPGYTLSKVHLKGSI